MKGPRARLPAAVVRHAAKQVAHVRQAERAKHAGHACADQHKSLHKCCMHSIGAVGRPLIPCGRLDMSLMDAQQKQEGTCRLCATQSGMLCKSRVAAEAPAGPSRGTCSIMGRSAGTAGAPAESIMARNAAYRAPTCAVWLANM